MAFTLTQLRSFCELAAAGNFGRAAEKLNMSQPPLSRSIAALERDLGCRLFARTPKGAELTVAGRRFLDDATAILALVAQARRNVVAAGEGETGTLTVGFTMCAAYSVIPRLTRLYKLSHPGVDLRLREIMPAALERQLDNGEIDFAIGFPGPDPTRFRSLPLLREPLDLVMPAAHPLARSKRLNVADAAGERFIIVPRNQAAALHDSIVRRCEGAGFHPEIAMEVYLQQTIVNLVAEGLGVAFVPTSMRRAPVRGAVFRAVASPPTIDQILFWSPRNASPCLPGFLAICDSSAAKEAGAARRRPRRGLSP